MESIEAWASIVYKSTKNSGDGYGYGSGYAIYIQQYNGSTVFRVDSIPTIISRTFGEYAKGYVIDTSDFTATPCYIARNKENGLYAHGDTLREAYQSLQDKIFNTIPVEERIEKFIEHFATDKTYKGSEFFEWHHILTGSCLFGRKQFIKSRHLALNAEYTVAQFISLCEHEYGGEVITRLKKRYEET